MPNLVGRTGFVSGLDIFCLQPPGNCWMPSSWQRCACSCQHLRLESVCCHEVF